MKPPVQTSNLIHFLFVIYALNLATFIISFFYISSFPLEVANALIYTLNRPTSILNLTFSYFLLIFRDHLLYPKYD